MYAVHSEISEAARQLRKASVSPADEVSRDEADSTQQSVIRALIEWKGECDSSREKKDDDLA